MKERLTEQASLALLKKGFTIKNISKCFDIVAKKEERTLLIKTINDINSLDKESIVEMKSLASYVDATPLIVAEKAGKNLEDNVVYTRFGIYIITQDTFNECLNGDMPIVKSSNAGLTVRIDEKALRQIKEEMSLGEISKRIGVSKNMIQRYGNSEISVNKAARIEEKFGNIFGMINVFDKIDEFTTNFQSELTGKYNKLGFKAAEMRKAPLDIVARKREEIILTAVGDNVNRKMLEIAELLNVNDLAIFERKKPKDIASIKKDEFLELEKDKELFKIIKEV